MISSGVDDQCKLAPWCPSCPPDFFSLFFRRLFVLCVKRSEAGGRLLLWLSFACRSCNDFTCWVKLPICSCICCIRTSCCSSAVSSCWILSSRCPNWSRRDVFSSRRCIRSSSIVIPVLYWVCRRLTSPADLSCYNRLVKKVLLQEEVFLYSVCYDDQATRSSQLRERYV